MLYRIKCIIPVLLLVNAIFCFGQKKYDLRFETSFLYLPKIVEGICISNVVNTTNKWGYGANLLGSYYPFKHFSVSAGIQMNRFNFYFSNNPFHKKIFESRIASRDIDFPLLISYYSSREKTISFSLSVGMLFGSNTRIKIRTIAPDGTNTFNPDVDMFVHTQYLALIINPGFSVKMNDYLSFTSRMGCEFLNKGIAAPDYSFISGRRITNINLGVLFKL